MGKRQGQIIHICPIALSLSIRQDIKACELKMTKDLKTRVQVDPSEEASSSLKVSIPVIATVRTDEGVRELEGRLDVIGEGHARIYFNRPLQEGTELSVLVNFKDRRNREIRFRYEGKVSSMSRVPWYDVDVDFEEGVGISGKDAREILSDLFPQEA